MALANVEAARRRATQNRATLYKSSAVRRDGSCSPARRPPNSLSLRGINLTEDQYRFVQAGVANAARRGAAQLPIEPTRFEHDRASFADELDAVYARLAKYDATSYAWHVAGKLAPRLRALSDRRSRPRCGPRSIGSFGTLKRSFERHAKLFTSSLTRMGNGNRSRPNAKARQLTRRNTFAEGRQASVDPS